MWGEESKTLLDNIIKLKLLYVWTNSNLDEMGAWIIITWTDVWEVKKVLYSFRSDNFNLIKQIEVTYVHIAQ